MFVAGIDAHATYSVIAIVSNTGQLVQAPIRIKNTEEDRLVELLEPYRPLEVVVETSPAWPWLFDRLEDRGIHFVLAHAKRLRVIAESDYKSDEIDAELLARMRLAGLIPGVYPKCIEQREQAVLLRNRARLVRECTRMVNRIHAQVHNVGLHLERGRLLTQDGRQWVRCGVAPARRRAASVHRHAVGPHRPDRTDDPDARSQGRAHGTRDPDLNDEPEPLLILRVRDGQMKELCRLSQVPQWAKPIVLAVMEEIDYEEPPEL